MASNSLGGQFLKKISIRNSSTAQHETLTQPLDYESSKKGQFTPSSCKSWWVSRS